MKKIVIFLFASILSASTCNNINDCLEFYKHDKMAQKLLYANLCAQKKSEYCVKAAANTEIYSSLANKTLEANKLYELGCKLNNAEACFMSAEYLLCLNPDAAQHRYKKACDQGYQKNGKDACAKYLNLVNLWGKSKKDLDIFKMYKPTKVDDIDSKVAIDACEAALHFKKKGSKNCHYAGYKLMLERDYNESKKYLQIACDMNNLTACLEQILVNDITDTPDAALNKKFLDKAQAACKNKDYYECGALGIAYWRGIAVKKDAKKARKLLESSCKVLNAHACTHLADLLREQDPKKALGYYYKACELDLPRACMIYDELLKDIK